jgi:tetratricopeptide (TPR) repeat protein
MENIEEIVLSLQEKINELSSAQALRNTSLINTHSRFIIEKIDSISNLDQLNKNTKAKLAYFKGRAMISNERYEKAAEELLSRSIKLDPRNGEAWSCLGELFYLKKDYQQSKKCFEASLEYTGRSKETLRKLSITYRLLNEQDQHKQSVLKSVDLAKEALGLDLNDAESWYILGNAHLTNYFNNHPTYQELEKSLKSYSQAQRLLVSPNPDLYYNKAIALNSAERYEEALLDLQTAHSLDISLNAESKSQEFYEKVKNIHNIIQTKCNIKKKNITILCKKIPNLIKSNDKYSISSVCELVEGTNSGKMLSLKILGYSKSEFPPIFVGCDYKADFFAVSIYDYPSHNRIVLGCGVFIRNPILLVVKCNDITYPCIQVKDSETLMIQANS